MSFLNTTFQQLVSQYNSWDTLRAYLESKEGGNLRCIDVGNHAIVRYVKGVSAMENDVVQQFRSVIWNKETNRPVCVSPFKAQVGEPPAGTPLRVTDFVDGVMMNAFMTVDGVKFATRTNIGANNSFYTKKSFAQMLEECFAPIGGAHAFFSRVLTEGQFVSMVMQHPDHKTVGAKSQPRVYIIHVGSVDADGVVRIDTEPTQWPAAFQSYGVHVYEASFTLSNQKAAWNFINSYQGKGHMWQGVVFVDTVSGKRWRLRNSEYVKVRTLRGAESDSFERFLRLRAQGQMKVYLSYFKEESNMMWAYEKLWRETTQALFDSYVQMNKLKQKTMKDLPLPLRPHVYALHGKYLASLPTPSPVSKGTVIDYVNNLAIEDQLKMVGGVYKTDEWIAANKV